MGPGESCLLSQQQGRSAVIRLRGHFNGQHIVLDQPAPVDLKRATLVEIVVVESRDAALCELKTLLAALWQRPARGVL